MFTVSIQNPQVMQQLPRVNSWSICPSKRDCFYSHIRHMQIAYQLNFNLTGHQYETSIFCIIMMQECGCYGKINHAEMYINGSTWVWNKSNLQCLVHRRENGICTHYLELYAFPWHKLQFDVRGSVQHTIIHREKSNKMQQCIRILLFHIYMKLNMFRATHRPSSVSGTVCLTTSTNYTSNTLPRMKNQRLSVQF
jgi:hypothetical protein